jgi:hypothetical protein
MTNQKRHYDPNATQMSLNGDDSALKREIRFGSPFFIANLKQPMLWSFALYGYSTIARGYFCGADPELLAQATRAVVSFAKLSLEREEWRAMTVQLAEDDSRRRFHGETEEYIAPRPVAWLKANQILLADRWLREGFWDVDTNRAMLTHDIEGHQVIEGAENALDFLPLSGWNEILTFGATPRWVTGDKRKVTATDTIAALFAADPTQLHDPKSPARKKARAFMKTNMRSFWLHGAQERTAMDWLRTVEWREGQSGLSPREVMLRAYAYMPDIDPPANLAREVEQLRKIPV